jgi:O-antigen/teichoic acid export membrane protein
MGLNTVLSLLVARQLGAEGLGKYAVLVAYLQIFQMLAVMGMHRLTVREMARQPSELRRWFQHLVVSQLLGAGGSAVVLILAARLLRHPADTTHALSVAALSLFPFAISSAVESALQAREQMSFTALAQTVARSIQVTGSAVLLLTGRGIEAIAWMMVVGQCIVAIVEVGIARWMGLWHGFRVELGTVWRLFRQSIVFFAQSISVVLFSKLDVLILSQVMGEKATGLYNAAFLIVRVINFISASYSEALYPVLSRLFVEARERFEIFLRKSLLLGMTLALLVVVVLLLVAEPLVGLLYQGREYEASVHLLQIVAPLVVVATWNALLPKALMASGLQHRSLVVSGVKLGTGLVYYCVLTVWLGAAGTAIATVLASLTAAVLNTYFVNKKVCSLDLLTLAVKPCAISATLLIVLLVVNDLAWPGSVVGGILCYALSLFVFRVVSIEDVRLFREIVWPF